MSAAASRYYYSQSTQTDEVITISLWPYRSLSIEGFRIVIGSIALALSIVGIGFMMMGAWPVLGFLGLEIAVVWFAFKLNYRAGRLIETIFISKSGVTIERTDWRGRPASQHIDSPWVTAELVPKTARRRKLMLSVHGNTVEIGAFLPPIEKPALAKALNDALLRMRSQHQS